MDALNRHCCQNQPSSPLCPHSPFPPFWGKYLEPLGQISQHRKWSGCGVIPCSHSPLSCMKLVPCQEGAVRRRDRKEQIPSSHGTAELQSWLNCLKAAISHWINTAESVHKAINSFSTSLFLYNQFFTTILLNCCRHTVMRTHSLLWVVTWLLQQAQL